MYQHLVIRYNLYLFQFRKFFFDKFYGFFYTIFSNICIYVVYTISQSFRPSTPTVNNLRSAAGTYPAITLHFMECLMRFKPITYTLEGYCSNQLSYPAIYFFNSTLCFGGGLQCAVFPMAFRIELKSARFGGVMESYFTIKLYHLNIRCFVLTLYIPNIMLIYLL